MVYGLNFSIPPDYSSLKFNLNYRVTVLVHLQGSEYRKYNCILGNDSVDVNYSLVVFDFPVEEAVLHENGNSVYMQAALGYDGVYSTGVSFPTANHQCEIPVIIRKLPEKNTLTNQNVHFDALTGPIPEDYLQSDGIHYVQSGGLWNITFRWEHPKSYNSCFLNMCEVSVACEGITPEHHMVSTTGVHGEVCVIGT